MRKKDNKQRRKKRNKTVPQKNTAIKKVVKEIGKNGTKREESKKDKKGTKKS